MGILDNVKGRFLSKNNDDWDDYDDDYYDDYDDGYYDDDYDDGGRQSPSDGVAQWPNELDGAGRRAGRLESGTPLVSATDVRSSLRTSASQRQVSNPTYDSAYSNYKIEPRDGLTRASNHSPEALDAARQELDQLQQGKPVPLSSYSGQGGAQVRTSSASRRIEPVRMQSYEDVQKISEAFRSGSSAAISLRGVNPELGRRILDFCFGVVSVSAGSVESLGNGAFFLNHGGIPITEAEKQQLKDEGIL